MSDVDHPGKRPAPTDGRSTRWDAHRARRREQLVDAALAVLGSDGGTGASTRSRSRPG
ncbi:hypothetical protein HBB16_09250 [Pseudonocardia sp. MCCB 268]|nr:hypothetical protein [Pseudonocardia cytotoxica]